MARDLIRGAGAAVAALGVMAAAAAVALWMLGVPAAGVSTVAAVMALAGGGRVTVGMSADSLPFGEAAGRMGALAGVGGELSIMPLGVTALGALTLAACLLPFPRRTPPGRRTRMSRDTAPLSPSALARRGFVALIVWTGGLALAARLGHGTLTGLPPGLGGGAPTGLPPGLGDGTPPGFGDLTFAADVATTVTGGLALGGTLLAFLLLSSTTIADRIGIRPAASAVGLVAAATTLLGTVTALAVGLLAPGLLAPGGDRIGGGLLLLLPNALAMLGGIGIGGSWHLDTTGILATRWPGTDLSLSTLDSPLPVAAITISAGALIACGLLTARLTPAGPRRAMRAALGLGLSLAVLLPALTILAAGHLHAALTVLSLSLAGFTADLTADPWTAGGLGLVAGALAGLTGSAATVSATWLLRRYRRRAVDPIARAQTTGRGAADPDRTPDLTASGATTAGGRV
jgi:hypothetical protein